MEGLGLQSGHKAPYRSLGAPTPRNRKKRGHRHRKRGTGPCTGKIKSIDESRSADQPISTPFLPTAPSFLSVQGYYDADQTRFVSGNEGAADLAVFEPFFDQDNTAGYRLSWPYSNPSYTTEWERFDNKSHLAKYTVEEGEAR